MRFIYPPNILAAYCCGCGCSWEDHPTKSQALRPALNFQDGRCINDDGCMKMVEPEYKANGDPYCPNGEPS